MTVGELVRHHRGRKGWSQSGLGRTIGKRQARISKIESDFHRPSALEVFLIAGALQIPMKEVFESLKLSQKRKNENDQSA